jgi:hypothetical protein
MDDLKREKESGLDMDYLEDVLDKKKEIGENYQTPGFGLAAQLFSTVVKHIIKRLGETEGEELLKEAIEEFAFERGKRIAERVKEEGLPLTLKNWLIYSDIETFKNFRPITSTPDGDFMVKVKHCTFYNAAEDWGLSNYAKIYCKYADYKILEGYNPDIELILKERQATNTKRCVFRYIMKEENKIK